MNDPDHRDPGERPIRPADLVGRPLPELTLLGPTGASFPLRGHLGRGPLVLFFYIHNGTPG